jgi:hypothetical protein
MTIKGSSPVSWIDNPQLVPSGPRPAEVRGRREKRQIQFERFSGREDADMIVDVLWHYVRNIPRYAATEGEYWALSCLPSTTHPRLTAISLHTMEAIYITEGDDGIPNGQVIASEEALLHRFGSWDAFHREHPGLDPDHDGSKYEDAGTDQIRLIGALPDVHHAIIDDRIGYAIRLLTNRVCAKGRTLHSRGHCPQLADLVLGDRPPTCSEAATS